MAERRLPTPTVLPRTLVVQSAGGGGADGGAEDGDVLIDGNGFGIGAGGEVNGAAPEGARVSAQQYFLRGWRGGY